jgi:hypothetical protein
MTTSLVGMLPPKVGFAWRLPWRRFSTPIKVGGGKVCDLGNSTWLAAGRAQGHGFLLSSIGGGTSKSGIPVGVGLAWPN